ncbi:hypothetical protein EYF80_050011 [Liparis tanakae]|uniref:Uncharacterized protein n=1 Tax=Liparis tanakae TaxID=230148 RepID=A0A4Z2FG13_9TELE|nr:hypothetical protein EYF80_050011 [Liparis tanakae]
MRRQQKSRSDGVSPELNEAARSPGLVSSDGERRQLFRIIRADSPASSRPPCRLSSARWGGVRSSPRLHSERTRREALLI